MQSCVLCSFVRCGSSNQIEKKKKEKKTCQVFFQSFLKILCSTKQKTNVIKLLNNDPQINDFEYN